MMWVGFLEMHKISLGEFVDDSPWVEDVPLLQEFRIDNQIDGVRLNRLLTREDKRGDLTVLISDLNEVIAPVPHAYLVTAAPGSIRAWVYHKRQSDRVVTARSHVPHIPEGCFPRQAIR